MQQENGFDEFKERTMKKLILAGTVLAIMLMAGAVFGTTADMIAGNPKNGANVVGEVTVVRDGDNLVVTYDTSGGDWKILTTHLHIWNPSEDDGPKVTGGGPSPGQFAWQVPFDSSITSAVYVIPLSGNYPGKGKKTGDAYNWSEGEVLNVAAHAVVHEGICNCEELLAVLPVAVTADIIYPGTDCYFDITIIGGVLDGLHKGWCADISDPIEGDETHLGDIYSTLCEDIDELPEDLIVYDSNLPLVNWLLNNRDGYTAGDVQYAIWDLLSGNWGTNDPGEEAAALDSIHHLGGDGWPEPQDYDPVRGLELAEAAEAGGVDFMPVCGEVMVVVFVPPVWVGGSLDGLPRQTVLIEIPAPCCGDDETAWAGVEGTDVPGPDDGDNYTIEFSGNNWAMYFEHIVEAP